jgi:ABC-2 type transport system permease protein
MTTISAQPSTRNDMLDPVPGSEHQRPDAHRVTASGVLRSEWVKLRSIRSSRVTLLAAAATLLLLGAIAAAVSGGLIGEPPDGGAHEAGDPTSIALSGMTFVALIIGVLGVMTITSEYAKGTIRSTMTFVPRRLPVLWAKVTVLIAVTLPVMVVASLATFVVGQALLDAGDGATASLGDPGVLRVVLGSGIYLTGVTVMGLALGTLLRGTGVAISTLFALVFLVPGLGAFLLPESVRDDVLLYLPSNAGTSFTSVAPGPELLSAGAGAVVFAVWTVVPVLAAAVALMRRPV